MTDITAHEVHRFQQDLVAIAHPFETTGCGVAPFRVVRVYEDIGPHHYVDKSGVDCYVGSPGQPMGTCKHCGTGIAVCYVIRDANGKEFTVGSSCVEKTHDVKLITRAKALKNARNREIAKARRDAKAEAARVAWEAGRAAREQAQAAAAAQRAHDHAQTAERTMSQYPDVLQALSIATGGFATELYRELSQGTRTIATLSDRQRAVVFEITAKTAGRLYSKAYETLYASLQQRHDEQMAQLASLDAVIASATEG